MTPDQTAGLICAKLEEKGYRGMVVPIEHLLDSSSYWNEEYNGRFRSKIHYFRWNNHVIWGLTAGILKDFLAETSGFGRG